MRLLRPYGGTHAGQRPAATGRGRLALVDAARRGSARTRDDLGNRRGRLKNVSVPLYQAKAELFRVLGHPVRIRVLELLCEGPRPVRELLAATEVEASNLSQQLAVLRRSGIVRAGREGATVVYSLAGPDVSGLMRAARRILTELITEQSELLAELQDEEQQQ